MSFIDRFLTQEVSYWEPSTIDKFGDRTFDTPVHLTGRWENKAMVFLTAKGDQAQTRAIVYSTDELLIDGYLYLGYSETANPETVSGADQIRRVDSCPDISRDIVLFKAYL